MEESKYKMPKQVNTLIRIGHITATLYILGLVAIYVEREFVVSLMSLDLNGKEAQIPWVDIMQAGILVVVNIYAGWNMVKRRTNGLTLSSSSSSLWSIFGIFVGMMLLQYPMRLIAMAGTDHRTIALASIMGSFVDFISWLYTISWIAIMIGFGVRHGWILCKSREL